MIIGNKLSVGDKLAIWEGGNARRAQGLIINIRREKKPLPPFSSLTAFYNRHQKEMEGVVDLFAQRGDSVAREVLGILKPKPADPTPEIETVVHYLPLFQQNDAKTAPNKGVIGIIGITLCADGIQKEQVPCSYVVAVAYHYVKDEKSLQLLRGKEVLVGVRTGERSSREKMKNLQDRLVSNDFLNRLRSNHQVAIVEIREFPAEAGDVNALFPQVISEASITIKEILISARTKITAIGEHIGEVIIA